MFNLSGQGMKKLMVFIIALISVFSAYAQNSSGHMTFKGIPIDGSLADFTVKMKQKGFSYVATRDGAAMFSGEFASYKGCKIDAESLQKTCVVSMVTVAFPTCATWSQLYDNYKELKGMLTKKYDTPAQCKQNFQGLNPTDDFLKFQRVKLDNCKYISRWETAKGSIELKIDHAGVSSCFVSLSYWDKINTEKVTNSASDDL